MNDEKTELIKAKVEFIKERKNKEIEWKYITRDFNDYFLTDLTPEAVRKFYSYHTPNNLVEAKEKVKNRDKTLSTNYYIRQAAREEMLKEVIEKAAIKINSNRELYAFTDDTYKINLNDELQMILVLSDWHYGIEINSYFNKYDPYIAKERLRNLLNSTILTIKQNKISKLSIVNLGDLISGRIHLNIRIDNQIDMITQVIEVCELLSNFIDVLSRYVDIDYYDCTDNHSRIEPNKEKSLEKENAYRLIHWYLEKRFENNESVHINKNMYGDEIISFNIFHHKIIGVHGHNDSPSNVISNLSLLTNDSYDLVLTAHLHHFSGEEDNNTVLLSNGSLMGLDKFSEKLRKKSRPSQNIILVSKDNVIEYIKRILV